jgi:hypothetical protein
MLIQAADHLRIGPIINYRVSFWILVVVLLILSVTTVNEHRNRYVEGFNDGGCMAIQELNLYSPEAARLCSHTRFPIQ